MVTLLLIVWRSISFIDIIDHDHGAFPRGSIDLCERRPGMNCMPQDSFMNLAKQGIQAYERSQCRYSG